MKIIGIDNDLARLFPEHAVSSTFEEVLETCAPGERIILSCDAYPSLQDNPRIPEALLEKACAKQVRLYVEYPEQVGNLRFSEPLPKSFERTFSTQEFGGICTGAIFAHHACWLKGCDAAPGETYLASAIIAGYTKAAFEIPEERVPLLYRHPQYENVLVAGTSLTCFRRARFAPAGQWRKLWQFILDDLGCGVRMPAWQMSVHPTFGQDEPLPADAEKQAFDKNVQWLRRWNISSHNGPLIGEGFDSLIDHEGFQKAHTRERSDIIALSALVLAFDWAVNRNVVSRDTCAKTIDRLFTHPANICLDPESPLYGQMSFYENVPIYYSSGNGLSVVSLAAADELLNRGAIHGREMLRCLNSLLRTTGRFGFRRSSFCPEDFQKHSPRWYAEEGYIHRCPHRQASMWAGFLLAFRLTGCRDYLEAAECGLRMTMEAFPDLNWMNGLSQEFARLLMPLAFLVQCDDTPEHRQWLDRACRAIEELEQPCGAIRESLGRRELGTYPPPESNKDFGIKEASLIQENGDPCCDTLYTIGFALLGLHEAAMATGEPRYEEQARRLAAFTVRIQAESQEHPELSGAWIRGFDYGFWDYWGSPADLSWGPWCAETGWGNATIAATLALRRMKKSLFELAAATSWRQFLSDMPEELPQMTKPARQMPSQGEVLGAER